MIFKYGFKKDYAGDDTTGELNLFRGAQHSKKKKKPVYKAYKAYKAYKGSIHPNYKNTYKHVLRLVVSSHADSLGFKGQGCFYCLPNKKIVWI